MSYKDDRVRRRAVHARDTRHIGRTCSWIVGRRAALSWGAVTFCGGLHAAVLLTDGTLAGFIFNGRELFRESSHAPGDRPDSSGL